MATAHQAGYYAHFILNWKKMFDKKCSTLWGQATTTMTTTDNDQQRHDKEDGNGATGDEVDDDGDDDDCGDRKRR
jgi:hypothetical protein